MKYQVLLPFLFLVMLNPLQAQEKDLTTDLYDTYDAYKEPTLDKRRVKHHEIQPLINKLAELPVLKRQNGMTIP